MTAMTRGPLPARVYWVRRVLAIGVVTGLVVGVVQLVSVLVGGGGSPQSDQPDQAAPVAAEVSTSPSVEPTENVADQPKRQRDKKKKKKNPEPVLAEPEGPCTDRDVAVTPTVDEAAGGGPVVFTLELRTIQSVACEWQVSPQTLSVKITSGDDDIWFSSQCPRSIPREEVVLRNNVTTPVEVTWSSRRSDEGCTKWTDWAMPGWYHIEAAALAGEPSDLQFRLTAPEPEVERETVAPDPKQGKGQDRGQGKDNQKKQEGPGGSEA